MPRLRGERGVSLVECLVAVALLGTAIVAALSALSTGMLAVGTADENAIARSLARSQMEYIKGYPYDSNATSYPDVDTNSSIALPDGFSVSNDVSSVNGTDSNIQEITVTVSREGETLLVIEDFKVNR